MSSSFGLVLFKGTLDAQWATRATLCLLFVSSHMIWRQLQNFVRSNPGRGYEWRSTPQGRNRRCSVNPGLLCLQTHVRSRSAHTSPTWNWLLFSADKINIENFMNWGELCWIISVQMHVFIYLKLALYFIKKIIWLKHYNFLSVTKSFL